MKTLLGALVETLIKYIRIATLQNNRTYMKLALIIGVIVLITSLSIPHITVAQRPKTWTVDDDHPADFSKIQDAIDMASIGDTILVGPGTYSPSTTGEVFPIRLKSGISLISKHGAAKTILTAENTGRVIQCEDVDNTTSIIGFTIKGGVTFSVYWPDNAGAGIYLDKSSPTIINNIITENRAHYWGGGIYVNQCSPLIAGNIITDNYAIFGKGAGINCYATDTLPIIRDNVITDNHAKVSGGGISCVSNPSILNNLIMNNSPDGIRAAAGTAEIRNNIIASNLVNGIIVSGRPIILNNIIKNNANGIYLDTWVNLVFISGNLIMNNTYYGIAAVSRGCNSNKIIDNTIVANGGYGIRIYNENPDFSGRNNIIYHNNLIDNNPNGYDMLPVYNNWYDPVMLEGNYWSDYDGLDDGSGVGAFGEPRVSGDGIGDTDTPHLGLDWYPFLTMNGWKIPATIDIKPSTINIRSKQKWAKCYIELPENYNVSEIDINSVRLNFAIAAELSPSEIGDYDNDGKPDLMLSFSMEDVKNTFDAGEQVTIVVMGEIDAENQFWGSDVIKVLNN